MEKKTKKIINRKQKIKYEKTDKVAKYHDEMKDLISFVFGYDIDGIFVSNGSSLYDFLGVMDDVKTIEAVVKKIMKKYNIDIKSIQDEPIVDIIDFMLKNKSSCFR